MSRFKFLTPWISVGLLSIPLLLRTPLPTEQSSRSLPKPNKQHDSYQEQSLLAYENTLLSFFTHHQLPPPRPRRSNPIATPEPIMEVAVELPPLPPEVQYQGNRFIKLGQAQRAGDLIFFIKDNQSGIIKEFTLNRPKDGYLLVQKDDKYYLESTQGEIYSL